MTFLKIIFIYRFLGHLVQFLLDFVVISTGNFVNLSPVLAGLDLADKLVDVLLDFLCL